MPLSKADIKVLARRRRWTAIVFLMKPGEVVLPVELDYDSYLSFKAVCLRENRRSESEYRYEPHFRKGVVRVIKTFKQNGESCK